MKKALIFNGDLIQVELVEFPVHPSMQWVDAPDDATTETHVFSGGAVQLKSLPPIARLKAAAKSAIKAKRDALILATPFLGKLVQSDLPSKLQIMAVLMYGSMPASAAQWRTVDNSYLTMTFTLFQQLYATVLMREGQAFAASSAHQDAVMALTTSTAVQAYDFSVGWPV